MNYNQYINKKNIVDLEYEQKLHLLRMDFVVENAQFKVGDFIGNVTGIIKVEDIGYEVMRDMPEIVYHGYRYKKVKGVLSRTKDMKMSHLRNYSLRLIQ
jgi:hypothetical protein